MACVPASTTGTQALDNQRRVAAQWICAIALSRPDYCMDSLTLRPCAPEILRALRFRGPPPGDLLKAQPIRCRSFSEDLVLASQPTESSREPHRTDRVTHLARRDALLSDRLAHLDHHAGQILTVDLGRVFLIASLAHLIRLSAQFVLPRPHFSASFWRIW